LLLLCDNTPMKTLLMTFLLGVSSLALADSCQTILIIETDDALYPGEGQVKLCVNAQNQATKLRVIKPVQNPDIKDHKSDQADERNPVMEITLNELNSATKDIPVLTPSRMGIEVKAALLKVPEKPIDKNTGGEVVLKVLKNKLAGSYHQFRLSLVKSSGAWKAYLIEKDKKTPLHKAFFTGGMSGIKRVEFY
jgi:hypothetical protein